MSAWASHIELLAKNKARNARYFHGRLNPASNPVTKHRANIHAPELFVEVPD
jgi:hypothetical protein